MFLVAIIIFHMTKTSIKQWAIDDRPREKLLQKGASHLSAAELIAILIQNGTRDQSALDLAKSLLRCLDNDLHKLSSLSVMEILALKIKGVGPAKAVSIAAAMELSIRRGAGPMTKTAIRNSGDIAEYLRQQFRYKKHEIFAVLYLNNANKINQFEVISEGGITGTVADPRIILKKALLYDAVSLVLCHNHPSGNLNPSRQDEVLTQKISQAAIHFDIKVIDHIIVSDEGYFSFADSGMIL
jgi:DNA repair protein RadC